MLKVNQLLVVCMGNICRSPMGEALFQRALPQVRVHSAGLTALVGEPADAHAQALMSAREIDISAHRAQALSQSLIANHELIFVMSQRQKDQLEQQFPSARGRVFRLGHWQQYDIADPYRLPLEAFQVALEAIEQGVHAWCARLQPALDNPA